MPTTEEHILRGDEHRKAKRFTDAIVAYEDAARAFEHPPADLCLKVARCAARINDSDVAFIWLRRACAAPDAGFTTWQSAAGMLPGLNMDHAASWSRTLRLGILSTYTTTQFAPMLRLALATIGVNAIIYEAPYGQIEQSVLDPSGDLYQFEPQVVLIAPHAGDAMLPTYADDPDTALETALARWTSLWQAIARNSDARVVQHNIAVPPDSSFGHLATRVRGARRTMLQQLNHRIGEAAGNTVSIVDCDAIAARLGGSVYFDDRYWHIAKQAVSLAALPDLARHTAAVIGATLGLTRKCLVLDLDNTLWGGVIGEDGLSGITLGDGAAGEAFVAFQQAVRALKERGIILAVCSKNNDADAREPFEQHPDMVLSLDDIALFTANWQPKSDNIRHIAETLNIGLDSLVFADDNPAERDIIRQQLPMVDVITLPDDPSGYVRALHEYLMFEPASFTQEDAAKTDQYKARAEAATLQASSTSLEDYWQSLTKTATIAPFDEFHLPRIVQLIGKTNQFNLTTRRHSRAAVEQFCADDRWVTRYLKLSDRFTDHGLVALLIAEHIDDALVIDTWLMSCRVIGRTVENALLADLIAAAQRRGCTRIRGTYIPTAKNGMVADVYARYGFTPDQSAADGITTWVYDLQTSTPIVNKHITIEQPAAAGTPA